MVNTMHFKMTAMLDEETRKAIRETLLGEAKGAARSEAQALFHKEMKDTLQRTLSNFTNNSWNMRSMATEALTNIFKDQWTDISKTIRETIKTEMTNQMAAIAEVAVEKVVQKKLADKTVWEATKQNDHIRTLAREELQKLFRGF